MIDEIYINGMQVDMSDDSGINLTYKGNVFVDIGKIIGNYSQTIKLPITANNMRIIDMCIYPSSGSRFPYIKHAGKIIRDGIEIINNADVFLLSISENIEITIVWDIFSALSSIFSGDLKLSHLKWHDEDGLILSKICNVVNGTKDNPVIKWGVDNPPFQHPVISLLEVFKQIKYMYDIDVLGDINLDSYVLPLTTNNVAPENELDKVQTRINTQVPNPSKFYRFLLFADEFFSYGFELVKEETPGIPTTVSYKMYRTKIYNKTGANLGIRISGFIVNVIISNSGGNIEDYDYTLQAEGEDVNSETLTPRIERLNNKRARLYYNGEISVGGNEFVLALPYDYEVTYEFVTTDNPEYGQEDLRGRVEISRNTLIALDRYILYCNMPDITIVDIIKTICAVECMYISIPDEHTIKFNRYSELETKKMAAYDWSEKIISFSDLYDNMDFHLDNFSQRNWLKWKEDDTVNGNFDGYISIDDAYYDDESDLFTSAFSATNSYSNAAIVPIYSIKDEKIQYKDVKPRFLKRSEADGEYYTTFFLSFENIVTQKYNEYINYINDACQITVTVRLSPIELKVIDLTNPVYIRQYGCYFLIRELKTKKNNLCEVKLLKM